MRGVSILCDHLLATTQHVGVFFERLRLGSYAQVRRPRVNVHAFATPIPCVNRSELGHIPYPQGREVTDIFSSMFFAMSMSIYLGLSAVVDQKSQQFLRTQRR